MKEKGISVPVVLVVSVIITAVLVGSGVYMLVPKETTTGATTTVTRTTTAIPSGEKFKVGVFYSSPIGDYGWYYAQDRAVKLMEEEHGGWLEFITAESVTPADSPSVIERMLEQGAQMVIAGSAEHTEAMYSAAEKWPDRIFYVVGGYKYAPNMGGFHIIWHQTSYMMGMMAGALTKTNKLGALMPFPMPDLIGQINAFTLGAQFVNPNVEMRVIETGAYYDPGTATTVTRTLFDWGADAITGVEDSPADAQEAQRYYEETGKQVYAFSRYSPGLRFGPDVVLSGLLYHWEKLFLELILKARMGITENEFIWVEMHGGYEDLGADWGVPINPKFANDLKAVTVTDQVFGQISVYDLIFERIKQFRDSRVTFDPFTGPIYDTNGNLRVRAGEILPEDQVLWQMDWFVRGVIPPQ